MPDSGEYHDPSFENPPSRHGQAHVHGLGRPLRRRHFLNWTQVSAFAHIAQIEHAIGF